MSQINENSPNIAVVKEYFRRGDAGRADLTDLFTDDVQFYFPKFGIGHGKAQFLELVTGFINSLQSFEHEIDGLEFIESGDHVVVEGTTRGVDRDGTAWCGGETPGGRFCSVYKFRDGQIARMHIYLDPDYTSRDRERFLWGDNRRW